jgi:hypothetical protein
MAKSSSALKGTQKKFWVLNRRKIPLILSDKLLIYLKYFLVPFRVLELLAMKFISWLNLQQL